VGSAARWDAVPLTSDGGPCSTNRPSRGRRSACSPSGSSCCSRWRSSRSCGATRSAAVGAGGLSGR
jgi:hypothetical protein